MKKLITAALAAAMLFCLAACNNNNNAADTSDTSGATTSSAATSEETTAEVTPESSAESEPNGGAALNTDTVLSAIRDAYGEDYYSNTAIPDEMLSDTFGLNADMYDEISSEMPMIGVHADRVIVVKAKDGKVADVQNALNTARESLISAETMYPMNIAKTNASQVVTNGNFVALILAGAADEREDATEDEQMSFAEEQTQKGVDAFNSCFQ